MCVCVSFADVLRFQRFTGVLIREVLFCWIIMLFHIINSKVMIDILIDLSLSAQRCEALV